MAEIILASGSPRRRELLNMLGLKFEVISADIDEDISGYEDLEEAISDLSFKKAYAVFKDHKDKVVIGADTIVSIDGEVLGKPHDEAHSKEMLQKLSGRFHDVITAVSIISKKESETFAITSKVQFFKLSDKDIDDYIKTKEGLDKAGAYAIQGEGAKYIKGIIGDYYAIMGLPVGELYHRINKYL